MGQSLDLHPVTILLSLMFWGFLWGGSWNDIGHPLAVIFKIVLQSNNSTRKVSDYMAGRLDFFVNIKAAYENIYLTTVEDRH